MITYLDKKDVREPIGDAQPKVICHCCNNRGKMGSGVALALLKKWDEVRNRYVDYYKQNIESELGDVQYIPVEKDTVVCNIIGQNDIYKNKDGGPPVRYWAIRKGFQSINAKFNSRNFSIHLPYLMGCDLAGGRWEEIEYILKDCFDDYVQIYIYDLFSKRTPVQLDDSDVDVKDDSNDFDINDLF